MGNKVLLSILMSFFTITANAADSFEVRHGSFDKNTIEALLSSEIGGVVEVQAVKWSERLWDNFLYVGSLAVYQQKSPVYTVDFILDEAHEVSCSLNISLARKAVSVTGCRSKTAQVSLRLLPYSNDEIGLRLNK